MCYQHWMRLGAILAFPTLILGCEAPEETPVQGLEPPVADRIEHWVDGATTPRLDEYYWIRDDSRSNPKVLALLEAENAYGSKLMAASQALQQRLFEEITTRLPPEDDSVPVQIGDFHYYRAYEAGLEYPIYRRFKNERALDEEVVLDVNQLAKSHDYYAVGNWVIAPNEDLVAYAEDTVSRRIYTIRIQSIKSGAVLDDRIEGAAPSIAWSGDGQYVFYIKKNPETLLEQAVFRHRLGTDQSQDELVYQEVDNTFSLWLEESRSRHFVFIHASSTDSNEILAIPRDQPLASPTPLLARRDQLEYRVRHVGDTFYFLTNLKAPNYQLMSVTQTRAGDISAWEELIAFRPAVYIEDFEIFDDFIVLKELEAGRPRLHLYDHQGQFLQAIPVKDQPATPDLAANPQSAAQTVRYELSSLKTPDSTLSYTPKSDEVRILKQAEIGGGFDPERYESHYLTFKARDGVDVPISLVYRNRDDFMGPRPTYAYAYGAYGYATDPYFRSSIVSLLDRGFLFAIIHVRGGQELGRQWYEQGRLLNKRNTFNDFIDGSRYLAAEGWSDPDNIFAAGGSAGGLLMGVIANEAPDLYQGVIAHVPFVDVVTTMLDDRIPLTTSEYREWGDPREPEAYAYMLSYSPYDQVKAQDYPHLFVTTGLYDSQVQYFEPVKWVSRLRRLKTDRNDLVLDIDMRSGHSGPSGRFERYQKTALEYAFILERIQAR